MRFRFSLLTKLWVASGVFLFAALSSIGLAVWASWYLAGATSVIDRVGHLRGDLLQLELLHQAAAPDVVAQLEFRLGERLHGLPNSEAHLLMPAIVPWGGEAEQHYQRLRQQWMEGVQRQHGPGTRDANFVAGWISGMLQEIDLLTTTMEGHIAHWQSRLHLFHLLLAALALSAAAIFMMLGYVLVVGPLARLQRAQIELRRGKLGTRLHVDSHDEFGRLAAGFNRMALALQTSHHNLERKVREKTASIEEQNRRLAALYAVSALAAEADTLEELARGFMQKIREVAGSDGIAVRWADVASRRYLPLATEGLPDWFLSHEQTLPSGRCECAGAHAGDELHLVPIAAAPGDDEALPECGQAGFRMVVAIPVRLQQRMLGEVSLFYRDRRELVEDKRALLSTMARHLASSMEGLRAAALERESAVAAERQLLARELHDSIAQSLAFLKIQMRLLRDAVADGDAAARDRTMAELELGVNESLADVRELLVHFRTRAQDQDMEGALRVTLSKFEHQTGIDTELSMRGHGVPLDADVQIQVLHIVQEALSNVRKHAAARHVALRVQREPAWRFEVHDDGRGFDAALRAGDPTHVGLDIMRERAQRIDASLRVESVPRGGGTTVTLELPAAGVGPSALLEAEAA